MTIIERARFGLVNALLGDEKRKLEETARIFTEAYLAGPWELPPQELARQLQEQDAWMVQDLLMQVGWETVGGFGYDLDSDSARRRAVQESVRLYRYYPLAQWSIWLWTGWGLGNSVTITPNDGKAEKVWDEFWTAERNAVMLGDDRIQELSNWLLVRGNLFLVFFASQVDGQATVRRIAPDEITEIVTNPDDDLEPWFYKREWTQTQGTLSGSSQTMYYPDWQAFFSEDDLEEKWDLLASKKIVPHDAKRAEKVNGTDVLGEEETGTAACVLHIAHNIKDDTSLWGWPVLTAARAWMQAHKRFMEDRLTVAAAVAMFVRRKKFKGGSRAGQALVDTIATTLSADNYTERNPPAVAGSVELDNAMIDTKDLPMRTGATDAKADNEAFSWKALLGAGLFPTSAGLDTSRWATALEMDKAQSMLFERYSGFWSSQFRKMVKVVLLCQEKYNGASFEDKSAQISTDTFSLADFPDIADSIGKLVNTALTPLVTNDTIPKEAARDIERSLWYICLQALGVDDAAELTSEDTWEPEEEEEDKTPAQLLPFTQPVGEEPLEKLKTPN